MQGSYSLFALTLFLLAGCAVPKEDPQHPLVGAWKATDATIFLFREDGTFHGVDFRQREIWGNWVELSPTRIGFQSLLHDSFYRPQYAILRDGDPDRMDYIVTGGTHFIEAERIDLLFARAEVERITAPQVHLPGQASQ